MSAAKDPKAKWAKYYATMAAKKEAKESDMAKAKKGLSLAKVLRAAESGESVGFCMACGRKAHGVEPDACRYECAHCHAKKVYGAEELVMLLGPTPASFRCW